MSGDDLEKYVLPPYREPRSFLHVRKRTKPTRDAFYGFLKRDGVKSILDVGCGECPDYPEVLGLGISYAGCDAVQGNIDSAKRLYPQVNARQGYAQKIPFPDKSFDSTMMCGVWDILPTSEDMRICLNECIRVSRRFIYSIDYTYPSRLLTERVGMVPPEMGVLFTRLHYDHELKKPNTLIRVRLQGIESSEPQR